MTFCLHTYHRIDYAKQTLLGRIRGAVQFRRGLLCCLLFMFASNCHALMQTQGVFELLPLSTEEPSAQTKEPSAQTEVHNCCPSDEVVQECESCLDDRAVQPRLTGHDGELEKQIFLFTLFWGDLFSVPPAPLIDSPYAPPPFSTYPSIYLTQLHFLE